MPAEDIFQARREKTDETLERVRVAFLERLGEGGLSAVGSHTTIYATGSGGRGDMGAASDLDPYVVTLESSAALSMRDASAAIAEALRSAVDDVGLPELDRDGEYASLVTAESLFENLGDPADDQSGALTRRMLLILESRALVNPDAYEVLIGQTIDAYWKNEAEHPADYLPIVLVNDIVRYWRTVLLNHESRLRDKSRKLDLSQEDEMALRRYSSYKLRVPRCLSCFSALAYLLSLTPTDPAHVAREDVFRMARMTPLERLDHLRALPDAPSNTLDALRELYGRFLQRTDGGRTAPTDELKTSPPAAEAVSEDGAVGDHPRRNPRQTSAPPRWHSHVRAAAGAPSACR